MTAYTIYRELSTTVWWAGQPRKVRWLAARFYSGADSLAVLRSHAEAQPVFRANYLRPLLTEEQVRDIIELR